MSFDRPSHWEVVCQTCMGGFVMSDAEVHRRLGRNAERLWPKHCYRVMTLRQIVTELPKEECNHAGCWSATNGVCSCSCRGKNHGVMNPEPSFSSVKVREIEWYRRPVKYQIPAPTN